MKKKRKSGAQRRQEWHGADRKMWQDFQPKLAAAGSLLEVRTLLRESPPPDAPGRGYYSDLRFFIDTFIVPDGSTGAERALYRKLVDKLDANGELKPGGRENSEKVLREARSPYMG